MPQQPPQPPQPPSVAAQLAPAAAQPPLLPAISMSEDANGPAVSMVGQRGLFAPSDFTGFLESQQGPLDDVVMMEGEDIGQFVRVMERVNRMDLEQKCPLIEECVAPEVGKTC